MANKRLRPSDHRKSKRLLTKQRLTRKFLHKKINHDNVANRPSTSASVENTDEFFNVIPSQSAIENWTNKPSTSASVENTDEFFNVIPSQSAIENWTNKPSTSYIVENTDEFLQVIQSQSDIKMASKNEISPIGMVLGNGKVSQSAKSDEHSNEPENIQGHRIVDIQFLIDQILAFDHCELFACSSKNIKVIREIRKGLVSEFVLECNMCKAMHRISSSKTDGKLNANGTAVLATINNIILFTSLVLCLW